MEWGTVAGVATALASLITALGGFVLAMKVMVPNFRLNQTTHKIVNQQHTDMERYQKALITALEKHGIDVPDDQSKQD